MIAQNRVFIGMDRRQPVGFNVAQWSIHANAKRPTLVQPLIIDQLPVVRRGLTEFTFTRFLVPYLCNFEGFAIFMDADMVVTQDINELFDSYDDPYGPAVRVMKGQPKFEWPSLMYFNCAKCDMLDPGYINDTSNDPASLGWADRIGELPPRWNVMTLASESTELPDNAALLHYTEGLPCFFETQHTNGADVWKRAYQDMNRTVNWRDLMGKSVHAKPVLHRMISRYFEAQPEAERV